MPRERASFTGRAPKETSAPKSGSGPKIKFGHSEVARSRSTSNKPSGDAPTLSPKENGYLQRIGVTAKLGYERTRDASKGGRACGETRSVNGGPLFP